MKKTFVFLLLFAMLPLCVSFAEEAPASAPLSEEELLPLLPGEWRQAETQVESLFISRGQEAGWDVQIVSPLTHGAAVFLGNFAFDQEEGALICNGGALYEAPITDEEIEEGYGALVSDGLYAMILPIPDGDALSLEVHTDMHEFLPVLFVRADAQEE